MTARAYLFSLGGVAAVTLEQTNSQFSALVGLLGEIQTDAQEEMQKEKVAWAKYDTWYQAFKSDQDAAIALLDQEITDHDTTAQNKEARVGELNQQISETEATVAANSQAKTKSEAELKEIKTTCAKEISEQKDAINALGRALETLKVQQEGGNVDMPALLQMADVPENAKRVLAAFLQDDNADEAALTQMTDDVDTARSYDTDMSDATTAYAYEFGSKNILTMIQDLQGQFEEKLRDYETACQNQKGTAELQIQDLTGLITNGESSIKDDTEMRASAQAEQGHNEKAAVEKRSTRKDTQAALDEATNNYDANKDVYDGNMKTRTDEITQLQQALTIFEQFFLLQQGKGTVQKVEVGTALVQMKSERTVSKAGSPEQDRILSILTSVGGKSNDLKLITASVRAGGAFDKVKDLIEGLMHKLVEEGREDAAHQDTCTREMATNKALLTKSLETQARQSNQLEKAQAELSQAEIDINRLNEESTATAEALADENELYAEKKQQLSDLMATQTNFNTMLQEGISTLEEFYSTDDAALLVQAENEVLSTSLLQDDDPSGYVAQPYAGDARTGNVLELLGTILEEGETTLSEATTQLEQLEKQHEEMVHSLEIQKTKLKVDSANAQKQHSAADKEISTVQADLLNTNHLVENQEKTKEQLNKACSAKVYSHEERQAQMQAEIDALNQVLDILNE